MLFTQFLTKLCKRLPDPQRGSATTQLFSVGPTITGLKRRVSTKKRTIVSYGPSKSEQPTFKGDTLRPLQRYLGPKIGGGYSEGCLSKTPLHCENTAASDCTFSLKTQVKRPPTEPKLKTPKSVLIYIYVHIWIYRKTEEGHLYREL